MKTPNETVTVRGDEPPIEAGPLRLIWRTSRMQNNYGLWLDIRQVPETTVRFGERSPFGGARLEESLTYDKIGNIKTRADTAGRTTTYDYDGANRLLKITDPLLKLTQFEYNLRSQMTKVKDALNHEYVFTYDVLGRELTQTRAGTTTSSQYDAVGNRTQRTDYLGRVTNYQYDALNRLTNINYVPSTEGLVTFGYDDLSRLTSAVNYAGTVSFTYDNRNRVKTSTDVFGRLVEYGYDANSNRTQLKLNGGVHTAYSYDIANRLTTLTDDASQNFGYGYDNANRLTSKTLPNGITSTIEYDGMSRLKRLLHATSTSSLVDNHFAYNPANQISQIAELAQTRNFGYDNVDRLTSMTNGTSNESYTFDGVGNRTASHLSPTYSYQPYNRMTATASATMSYNANGNLIQKSEGGKTWTFTWDYENRMTSVTNGTQTLRYRYDGFGRRVERYIDGTTDTTKFTYDGLDVVMDDDATAGLTKYQNGSRIDNKLSLKSGGVSNYFVSDHLGSTVALTDSSGAVTEQTSYDSFGNATNAGFSTRYQYTGREYDAFSGFYYYRARWYDSNAGRFVSEDPIGFSGGNINLFAYVNNNPTKATDPLGLYPWDWRDFVAHYFTGGGRSVDLANVGLLPAFRSSSSVIARTTGFRSDVIRKAKSIANSECEKNCVVDKRHRSTYFPLSDRTSTDVTSEPGLFAVGRSTFYRNAVCFINIDCTNRTLTFKCTLGFSIRDRFTDPLDGERAGFPFNLPGSQPYAINARWEEDFSGGCSF